MLKQLSFMIAQRTVHALTMFRCASVLVCMMVLGLESQLSGQEPAAPEINPRELFVPFDDLNILLGSDTRRVFMTRAEFEQLRASAKQSPAQQLPHEAALLAASYDAVLETGRATLKGDLQIEVLGKGIHIVPLSISGVGIRSAELDGQAAMLAEDPKGMPQLVVEGIGMHTLHLEMILPVTTAAAQQSLGWQVPVPSTTKFHLTVPGNVEMKSGAAVVNRRHDSDAEVTHFDIVPSTGQMNLVMSLNNRRLRDETSVLARGVFIDEITQGYERLHATLSMNILHGASDEFRIAVPVGFEITQVSTPLLSRWNVENLDGTAGKVLVIQLRELTAERVVINIRADRAGSQLDKWQMPKLIPLDVAGFAGVVGVLLEERLTSKSLETSGLIEIDNQLLSAALPESVRTAEPGMPHVRPLAAYYAAQAEFELATSFVKQPPQLFVSTNLLMTVGERKLELDGGFALRPESEKLFSFEFEMPKGWAIDNVRVAEGAALSFARYVSDSGSRIRVQLPSGLSPRTTLNVLFHATLSPEEWLSDWNEQTVGLPIIAIKKTGAVHESGAVAVRAIDDLRVSPATSNGLIVLSDNEKSKTYGQVTADLAWRYTEEDWDGSLLVTRTAPRMTSRILSFYQLSPEALTAHFELITNVEQARTQRLSFSLPESTPGEISIRGMDETSVKETHSQLVDGRRQWTAQLAEKKTGRIRLAIDFVQPISDQTLKGLTLPELRAENVVYQSGLIALEGHPEIDVTVAQHPRAVDMGELIDAEYQVGKRLLGVFSYVGSDGAMTVDAVRRTIHPLPTTIVQRAELFSMVGRGGVSQTAARFLMRTKALYLEARLPEGATLWSVLVDGQPALPERQGEQLMIALAASPAGQIRDLQIIYEQSIAPLQLRGDIELVAPMLWQRAERDDAGSPVPLADLRWELRLPGDYRVVHSDGTVIVTKFDRTGLAWLRLPSWRRAASAAADRAGAEKTPTAPTAAAVESTRPLSGDIRFYSDRESASAQSNLASGPGNSPDVQDVFATPPLALAAPQSEPPLQFPAQPPSAGTPPPAGTAVPGGTINGALGDQPTGFESNAARAKDSRGKTSVAWALAGVRPLAIDLATASPGESIIFASLGIDPVLRATVVDQRRWHWLGTACGLIVFVFGWLRIRNRSFARLRFVAGVVLVALLLPPVTGWSVELQPIVSCVIFAAAALLVLSVVGTVLRGTVARTARVWHGPGARPTSISSTASIFVLSLVCSLTALTVQPINAQDVPTEVRRAPWTVTSLAELEALVGSLPDAPPVKIPADAIVIPYDPAAPDAIAQAEKLLVPYDDYVRLWNVAHPEQQLTSTPPTATHAWSGADYEAVLTGENDLKISGTLSVQVLADGNVSVPLAIGGGVLESLTVDGSSAQLQVVRAGGPQVTQSPLSNASAASATENQPGQNLPGEIVAQQQQQQQAQAIVRLAAPAAPSETLLLLHLSGKGRKELAIQMRLKIERRGGWRVVEGRLPTAPATALTLRVPQANTEVRLNGLVDRAEHETEADNQQIETALPSSGRVAWQWRAKIAQASVDQGLSVDARSVFDVQEDALKFAWHGDFQFRRGRRESFTLLAPRDYLIEKVIGANVRGWSVEMVGDKQQVTVDLLATVAERESLTLYMMREHTSAFSDSMSIQTPAIEVPDAMLQQGQLAVRRSALLELRSGKALGLRRIDTPDDSRWSTEQADAGPLPLKAYQAFQYSQLPYELEFTAEPTASRTQVTAQTLVKLSQLESVIESRLIFNIQDRPLHHVRMTIPGNWKLEPPQAPVAYEWNVQPTDDGRQSVELVFASGLSGEASLVLRGTLVQSLSPAADGSISPVPLPKIEVQGVNRQTGDIVVTSDPAFDVRAVQLQGSETVLLGLADSWLAANQRPLARLMIHYASAEFSGQLRISLRAPQVNAFSVTNVKLTDRSIEETILIEFAIRSAGIRQISITLPSSLAQAQVRGPMIRSRTWTPLAGAAGSPVRLQVELQEDVMGQYSLIIENDRLLTTGVQPVPIPVIETGQTDHRFVTLENTGRDELLVTQRQSLEPLERSQAQWRFLNNLLGGKATEAFVVRESDELPLLSFATKDRAIVETVGARIGIAQTLIVVDENGAYRAKQEVRIENRTEQFLEIELPQGARLWSVIVAGEPVKPMAGSQAAATTATAGTGQRVRIPLVKTAAGDLDYSITIKYGGQLVRPGGLRTTTFPLLKTINLNVELSQVRLRLPETKRWMNFGGSMGRVLSEEEMTAGWLSFRTRQLNELSQLLSKADDYDFSKARAMSNLKQLGREVEELQQQSSMLGVQSDALQQQLSYNNSAWMDAQQHLKEKSSVAAVEGLERQSNRMLLNKRVGEQENGRSLNVANDIGDNFFGSQLPASGAGTQTTQPEFDARWFADNNFKGAAMTEDKGLSDEMHVLAERDSISELKGRQSLEQAAASNVKQQALPDSVAKPAAPKIAALDMLNAPRVPMPAAAQPMETRAGQVYRYQQRLEQQQSAQNAPNGGSRFGAATAGRTNAAQNDFSALDAVRKSEQAAAQPGPMSVQGFAVAGDVVSQAGGGGGASFLGGEKPSFATASQPGYLVSLDTELPLRGVEYLFTTPRGEIEITAQSVSEESISRLSTIAVLLIVGAVTWFVLRPRRALSATA